jgi:bacillopeptidase F
MTLVPSSAPAVSTAAQPPHKDVLIARMKETADLSGAAQMPRGADRRTAVYSALVETAQRSQAGVIERLAELQSKGFVTSFESMFLPNAVVVRTAPGQHAAVEQALRGMASIQDVAYNRTWSIAGGIADAAGGAVELSRKVGPTQPNSDLIAAPGNASSLATPTPSAEVTPEWGVEKIGAPLAWAKGFTGQGITVGVVDTGFDAQHPALRTAYRGTNADGTQTHDYNWFDGTAGRPVPYDDGAHGTHVAGTVAGAAPGKVIGVAPGAKVIAAKAILGRGYNTTEATLKALQFMLAPTDINGKNADPARGADIVNNSWGNADRDDRTFIDTWNAFQAAGIIMVTSAGNDGPLGKVSPPGSYPNGISVAATGPNDKVAGYSSRGPSNIDPKAIIPMLAAPGSGVLSSVPGGRYGEMSGTSMAAPHVAGAVALMLSAKPDATYEQITSALARSATDISEPGPDNAAGHGRINVDAAIKLLLAGTAASVPAGELTPRSFVAPAAA